MVVQTTKASEHAQKVLDLLAEADAHIAASEYDSVSGKLWGAVEQAITAVAEEHGWKRDWDADEYKGLRSLVKRIEKECGGDGLSGSFVGVSLWLNNRDYHFLDDYEYEFFSPSAHRFVSEVLNLNEAGLHEVVTPQRSSRATKG